MNGLLKALTVLFFWASLVAGDDSLCPCSLDLSSKYPYTYKWDCRSLELHRVPGECYDIQSTNVSELDLSYNKIGSIRTVDFFGLTDLKLLYLDHNQIKFFDHTALEGLSTLEVFEASHNTRMELPVNVFEHTNELQKIRIIGSKISDAPDVSAQPNLEVFDLRSCNLDELPKNLFGEMASDNFLFNLIGNNIEEISAETLLPVPDEATMNLDRFITVWAKDAEQKDEVLAKNWILNFDLTTNLKVCGEDGYPKDKTICAKPKTQ